MLTKCKYPEVHCCIIACNGYYFILLISECRYHPSPHAIWQCFRSLSLCAHEPACQPTSASSCLDDVNERHLVFPACSGTGKAILSSHSSSHSTKQYLFG